MSNMSNLSLVNSLISIKLWKTLNDKRILGGITGHLILSTTPLELTQSVVICIFSSLSYFYNCKFSRTDNVQISYSQKYKSILSRRDELKPLTRSHFISTKKINFSIPDCLNRCICSLHPPLNQFLILYYFSHVLVSQCYHQR